MIKTWTTHEQKNLEALYKNGHTSREISCHMERSIHSINKALCRFQLRKISPKRPHRQLKISLSPQQLLPFRPDDRLWCNISGESWLHTVAQNAISPKSAIQPHILLKKLYKETTENHENIRLGSFASLDDGMQWLKEKQHIVVVKKNWGTKVTYQVNGGFGVIHQCLSKEQLKEFINKRREKMGMPSMQFHAIT